MTLKRETVKYLAIGMPILGLICVILYALTAQKFGFIAHAFGTFVLTAGAAFITGSLIGFLFGIPKSAELGEKGGYRANTNLEQISDWLTKILLGVGLTQMDEISGWVGQISNSMAKKMTLHGDETMFISSLIIFFTVCGFLDGYLVTRIILPRVFAKSDQFDKDDVHENPVAAPAAAPLETPGNTAD